MRWKLVSTFALPVPLVQNVFFVVVFLVKCLKYVFTFALNWHKIHFLQLFVLKKVAAIKWLNETEVVKHVSYRKVSQSFIA